MKRLKRILWIFVIFAALPAAYAASQKITVEIDYGGVQQNREVEITWKQGITALEALQSVAQIETLQIGEYLFVTSIDGVEGKKGDKAWYYDINGKRATSFANRCILNKGDHMRWEYTKDVCSSQRGEQ
ncbi:MAG: DUF4430 domain-containing protein [Candidatus Brocadia sp.]|jgi:hypothetical protein